MTPNLKYPAVGHDLFGVASIFALIMGIFLFFDRLAAVSLHHGFTAVFVGLVVLAGGILLRRRPFPQRLLIIGLLVTAVLATYFINWDSRKPFLRAFHQIEPGMTQAQVEDIMEAYQPFRYFSDNDDAQILSYRHTSEGWGDADIGQIYLADGRVTHTRFLPD